MSANVWTTCRDCGQQTTFGVTCMGCSNAACIGQRPTLVRRHDNNGSPYWSSVERTPDGFQRTYTDTES